MRMYLEGKWVECATSIEVKNPYSGAVLDTVPQAGPEHVERATQSAVLGARDMARMTAYDRASVLRKAATLLRERAAEFGRLISSEEGKVLREGQLEASRAAETLDLSADEAKRLTGETLPMDSAPGGAGKFAFTIRVPCGVVAAITPFNFPLNLVCHKVGPALAAGNAVIVKPASDTPLSALKLVELLLEAGLPPLGIACLTGPGRSVGEAIARDARIRKLSFTGSRDVGEQLCRVAGLKRVTMELGSNSPLIVMPDADLDLVARGTMGTAFVNSGQTCISTQRVIAVGPVYDDVLDLLAPQVSGLRAGDQLDPANELGPLIRETDAERVGEWIREAVRQGARVVSGGERQGAVHSATLVADVDPSSRLFRDELFGPAVGVMKAPDIDTAIALANDSRYGLSAGIFTRDLDHALKFARRVESGNIHVNWGPGWRADFMPYGGFKESGFGKEGPRYAISEMTETKTVVIHGS